MSWKETGAVEQRLEFVLEYAEMPEGGFSALCRKYGISRKTGYKWVWRYDPDRPDSLRDRSRVPRRRRERVPAFGSPFEGCNAPNDVWCAGFKGHFRPGVAGAIR